jgi:hypothetical protein
MGHFIDLAAVLKPQHEIESYFERVPADGGISCYSGLPDRALVSFHKATGDFTRIIALSSALECPVVALHIHDEDLWTYEFYVAGELKDRFNTYPSYWKPIKQPERDSWKGDASVIASHWKGLDPAAIDRYLIHQDTSPPPGDSKSYPDDEFEIGDCWQICDFLHKLGTPYPND